MARETIASVKADYRRKSREAEAAFAERERALAAEIANAWGSREEALRQLGEKKTEHAAALASKDNRIAELLAANNCFEQKARDARVELGIAKGVIGHLASVVDTLANHKV